MTRYALAAAGLATVLTLAACGSSSSGTKPAASPPPAGSSMSMSMPAAGGSSDAGGGGGSSSSASKLVIKGFAYSGHLTVKPGEKVSVVNEDGAPHTVTSNDGKFDSGTVNGSGGTGTFTAPTQPGTYKFGCNFHPNMAGTLTVTG